MRTETIAAAILTLAAACAARAGETLAPEKALPLHEDRDAYAPCAAFVKGTYIVAWQSGRLAPGDLREGFKFNGDIVGCRVGKDGNAIDGKPFVICGADDLQERPRAAAGKDVALVVWQDLRNGKDWDVYAARVSPDGKVLDPDGLLVAGGAHNQANPKVAWDGKTFVVVWQDFRSGKMYEICAARVSADGKGLDAQGLGLSKQKGQCLDPAIASSGDGRSFVYWSCANNWDAGTHADAASEGLFLVDGQPGSITHKQSSGINVAAPGWHNTPLFLCAGKASYLLAWRNEHPVGRGNGSVEANAFVFDAQGKQGPKLTLAGSPHRILTADLAWDGSAFVAAWTELRAKDTRAYPAYEHIFVSRIAPDGKLIGPYQLVAGCSSPPENWGYPGGQRSGGTSFKPEPPAMNACAASDGTGTTLIAYEKHPDKAETPITIGFRLLRAGP